MPAQQLFDILCWTRVAGVAACWCRSGRSSSRSACMPTLFSLTCTRYCRGTQPYPRTCTRAHVYARACSLPGPHVYPMQTYPAPATSAVGITSHEPIPPGVSRASEIRTGALRARFPEKSALLSPERSAQEVAARAPCAWALLGA